MYSVRCKIGCWVRCTVDISTIEGNVCMRYIYILGMYIVYSVYWIMYVVRFNVWCIVNSV